MIMDEYMKIANEYPAFFKAETAPKGKVYTESTITGLGDMRPLGEGEGVDFDVPAEGDTVSRGYSKFGLGFQLVEEAEQDDIQRKIPRIAGTLGRSAGHKIDLTCFKVLNLGDTVASVTGKDGLALFANNHVTLKSGDTINNIGSAALSETALAAAFEYFNTRVTQEGFPTNDQLSKVLVSEPNRVMLQRLHRQAGQISSASDTAEVSGNIMSTNSANGFYNSWTAHVLRYLAANFGGAADAWFALSARADLRLLWKWKPRTEASGDFRTGNRMYKLTMRLAAFANEYETMYGSFPT
jgi:hypothetical protein